MFSIIVAMGENREIGKKNKLLWHIPEDLKNFKKITTGKTVIMGRKTFESIGKALPNRRNIVLSRTFGQEEARKYEIEVYDNFDDVIKNFYNVDEEVFIIGGEDVYITALKYVKKLYISYIKFSDKEADAYFPKIDYREWGMREEKQFENWNFSVYERL